MLLNGAHLSHVPLWCSEDFSNFVEFIEFNFHTLQVCTDKFDASNVLNPVRSYLPGHKFTHCEGRFTPPIENQTEDCSTYRPAVKILFPPYYKDT